MSRFVHNLSDCTLGQGIKARENRTGDYRALTSECFWENERCRTKGQNLETGLTGEFMEGLLINNRE